MSSTLLTVLTFAAGALGVAALYSILSDMLLGDRSRVSRRVDDEFRQRQRDRARKAALFKDLGPLAVEVAADEAEASLHQRFVAMVEQSGLEISPQRLLALAAAAALALGALGVVLRRSLLVGGAGVLIGAAGPLLYVHFKRKARQEKLLGQLSDAFDLMARVIRAGQTLAQALQAVADEFEPPIAAEFSYCYEQQNLGLPPEMALRDLARRTGLLEMKIFVLGVLIQQQTGGNLAELLDKLAGIVRDRFKMRGKIKALTAEGRMQASVLLAMPPAMFLIILFLNRNYAQTLLDHPSLLVAMLISEGLGAVWIRKIVNFDY